jgi:enoyl-CoA hydratase/carnithine racemase
MATGQVRYELQGPIAYVTFDRPEARNALTFEMYEQLHEVCGRIEADGARVAVLRGAGDKAFVAGTDIREFTDFDGAEDGLAYERRTERVLARLERLPVPTIAAIRGYAVGGGFSIASVCDLRIATPDARFGVPIARTLGNCLSMEGYARAVALLGPSRTKYLLLTASLLDAGQALAAGYLSEVVPPERLEARAEELATQLAGNAPITLRVTKEAVRRITAALRADGDDLVRETYSSADFKEGVSAFLDKRTPRWQNR